MFLELTMLIPHFMFSPSLVLPANMASADFWPFKVRPPWVRIIAFTPYTCYIYHTIFWKYRILFWLANSSRLYGLICSSCSSGRSFAYSFLQIPPRDGHPCCSANGCYCQAITHARRTRYPRPYRRGAFKIQAPLVLYLPSLAFLRIL